MANSAIIHARIDSATKEATERILESLGLTPTEAVRLFYRQIAIRGEFPLELRVPNQETAKVLDAANRGEDMESVSGLQELYDSWGA